MEYTNCIGKRIVGYRYGKAPSCGRSWNYREQVWEPGVSMAQVGFDKEIGSFAVSHAGAKRNRYYYIGTICGTGGDDEVCLTNVQQISRKEYLDLRKQMTDVSNLVVNYRINRSISILKRGWLINRTVEELESERKKYLKI